MTSFLVSYIRCGPAFKVLQVPDGLAEIFIGLGAIQIKVIQLPIFCLRYAGFQLVHRACIAYLRVPAGLCQSITGIALDEMELVAAIIRRLARNLLLCNPFVILFPGMFLEFTQCTSPCHNH